MDHVGINVTHLQRSADWYERILGFTIFHKWKTTWMISRGNMDLGLFLRRDAETIDDLDNTQAITEAVVISWLAPRQGQNSEPKARVTQMDFSRAVRRRQRDHLQHEAGFVRPQPRPMAAWTGWAQRSTRPPFGNPEVPADLAGRLAASEIDLRLTQLRDDLPRAVSSSPSCSSFPAPRVSIIHRSGGEGLIIKVGRILEPAFPCFTS